LGSINYTYTDMKKNIVTILVISLFLAACSGNPEVEIPEEITNLENLITVRPGDALYTLQLQENLYLNQLDEEHTQNLWALYSDQYRNFYWADNYILQIHQYSPEGTYVRSFGEKGHGPGEFDHISRSTVYKNRLYVFEYGPQKVHVFNTDTGDFVESFAIEQQTDITKFSRTEEILVQNDSTILGIQNSSLGPPGTREDSLTVSLYRTDGRLVNPEFFRYRKRGALEGRRGSGRFSTSGKFTADSKIAMLPDGQGFVHSHASDPVFYFYNSEGDYQKAFYLALDPIPLTKEQINHEIENSNPMIDLGTAVQHAESIPDTWPYWQTFFVSDDGNLWVIIFSEPPYGRELWVISPDGNLLAQEQFELQDAIRFIDSDHLYTTYRPDGIFEIRRYNMAFQEK